MLAELAASPSELPNSYLALWVRPKQNLSRGLNRGHLGYHFTLAARSYDGVAQLSHTCESDVSRSESGVALWLASGPQDFELVTSSP